MYKLKKPNKTLEDFFDDLLTGRQGESGKFRQGRLKAIKKRLITDESLYQKLVMKEGCNELHKIEPVEKIEIPGDTMVLDFFNFPSSITKENLLEKLKEYKIERHVKDVQTKLIILQQLEGITLHDIYNDVSSDEEFYEYTRYTDRSVMTEAYENYLVKGIKGEEQSIYDCLLLLADNAACPYCLIGDVSTLDHYLPKSQYINYSITPINLIPCCADCNGKKGSETYSTENKLLINAYFEDVTKVRWLYAEVVEELPITFDFKVSNDIENELLRDRLKNQFTKLNLERRYNLKASRYFGERVKSIALEYSVGGLTAVKRKLESDKDSAENYNLNTVNAKVYESLLNSNWFMKDETLKEVIDYYEIKLDAFLD